MPERIPSTVIVGVQARAETCSPLVAENKLETRLNRTAATWIAYLALIYFALVLNCLGSVTSLIRLEQKLTYAQAGLLGSSFASGLIVASLVAAAVSSKLGSWKTLALAGRSGCQSRYNLAHQAGGIKPFRLGSRLDKQQCSFMLLPVKTCP